MFFPHVIIISWPGQHENAVSIARQVLAVTEKVSIVYSDADSNLMLDVNCNLIRRPDHLFWGDKFKASIDACGDDPILVIHADCSYADWAELVRKCHRTVNAVPEIGVWAPKIDFVPWSLQMMKIADLKGLSLSIVARTDGIVFYLSPVIIERMRRARYEENVYGWGIEWMFVCTAYSRGLVAVIDTSIEVTHPQSDGSSYPRKDAQAQMELFLKQLGFIEEVQGRLLKSRIANNGGMPIKFV